MKKSSININLIGYLVLFVGWISIVFFLHNAPETKAMKAKLEKHTRRIQQEQKQGNVKDILARLRESQEQQLKLRNIDANIDELTVELLGDPNNPDLWYAIGSDFLSEGDYEEALKNFEVAEKLYKFYGQTEKLKVTQKRLEKINYEISRE